jgi:hypothetical protein
MLHQHLTKTEAKVSTVIMLLTKYLLLSTALKSYQGSNL